MKDNIEQQSHDIPLNLQDIQDLIINEKIKNIEQETKINDKILQALHTFTFDRKNKKGTIRIKGYHDIVLSEKGIQSGDTLYKIYAPGKKDEYPRIIDIQVKENQRNITLKGKWLFFTGTTTQKVDFQKLVSVFSQIIQKEGENKNLPEKIVFPTNNNSEVYLEKEKE